MSWSMIVRCEMIQKGINALTEEHLFKKTNGKEVY